MADIPESFNQSGAAFVLLPAGKKFPPIEKGWQQPEKAHTFAEACQHRGNVGILAGGRFGGLDEDNPAAFQGLELGATTTWETRPGRMGFWLRWADSPAEILPAFGFKADQAQIFLFKEGAQVGEVKLQRSYQAIPPSWKTLEDGTRADYKLLDSSPPAEISLRLLLEELQGLGISFSENEREKPQLEANAQKLEDMAREARSRRAESEESRERKYADAALQGEVLELAGTAEGSRNDQLNKSAFALGQFVAAGILSELEVIRALSKAATYAGLTPEEIEATIKSGLEAGARHPREIPDARPGDRGGAGDPGREMGGEEKGQCREKRNETGRTRLQEINEHIPAWIEKHHFKTTEDTERLYHYEHGVYLDNGETVLKALVESEFPDLTTDTLIRDIIGKVKRRTYIKRDIFNNGHVLNVKNGLIDLDTQKLRPHSPDYLSTAQIGVLYNPAAKAPGIQQFLREVAQSKDIALIEEVIGWLLWPDYNIHKALMLLGQGRNGKGTLLRLITAFLGKINVSNVSLQELVADRFAKADLYGKLSNIGGDLPSKDLSDTASFRMLTGEDDNRAQEKYRQAFSFKNKAKLLFSANVLPRSPDDTYAFYSRWIILEFLNKFDVQKGTGDPDLLAKLTTEEELSGLLNIALAGLARLRAAAWRFSYDKTVEDVEIMYKRNSNPVLAFLLDECEERPDSYIEKNVLLSKFKEYAQNHGLRPLSTTKFSELLKDQTEIPVSTFRPWIEHGDRPMCWLGLRFKVLTKAQSIPSILEPTPSYGGENELEEEGEDKEVERVGITGSIDGIDCEKKPPPSVDCLDMPTPGPEEIRFLARFRTEYTTQWPRGGGRYESITYQEGDECVAPFERAWKWKGRGVVDLVEVVLPWEPPEEATA